jgi:enterochelin esterase-like enzyme
MTQHLTEEQFTSYINHTLTDAGRETMDRHLAGCPDCRTFLAGHEALARRIQYDLGADLRAASPSTRMNFRAIAPRMKRSRRVIMFARQSNQLMAGAVTLLLLLALGFGLYMLINNLSQPLPVPPVELAEPAPAVNEEAGQAEGASADAESVAARRSDQSRLESGQITSQALAGNLIGDPATRRYWVYLPPGYDTSGRRYPVVYALHGFWLNSLQLVTPLGEALDELLAAGQAREMIVVYPDGNNRFRGSQYRSSPTVGDYETYIAGELVEQIDATYRTLPQPESRGITGCYGNGALHLAFKHPDVFSVAAPVSAVYDFERKPQQLEMALASYQRDISDLHSLDALPWQTREYIALAAAVAPNPDKPPLYLDMPLTVVDGQAQIVPEVWEKILAAAPVNEVNEYLDQPERLRALLLYQDAGDVSIPVEVIRDFDRLLTSLGVEHELLEVDTGEGRCWLDYSPVVQFMSDNLVFDE